jgi:site-specific DNA-methyltransferase (adenine-specific)
VRKKAFEYNDTGFRYPTQVLKFQRDCLKSNLHLTQKPLLLCEYLIKTYTNQGDIVLDNSCGSGTTLLAAKNLNRQFIGIEKEKEYYDICIKRLK